MLFLFLNISWGKLKTLKDYILIFFRTGSPKLLINLLTDLIMNGFIIEKTSFLMIELCKLDKMEVQAKIIIRIMSGRRHFFYAFRYNMIIRVIIMITTSKIIQFNLGNSTILRLCFFGEGFKLYIFLSSARISLSACFRAKSYSYSYLAPWWLPFPSILSIFEISTWWGFKLTTSPL